PSTSTCHLPVTKGLQESIHRFRLLDEDTAKIPLAYGSGLQWEFTWSMKDNGGAPWATAGVTYHEVQRFIEVGDTVMLLSWTTHDDDWDAQRSLMNRVFGSFHPRGGE
ncbi:DUF1931 family protein, partial [Streptosporangium sp. NPDC001682]